MSTATACPSALARIEVSTIPPLTSSSSSAAFSNGQQDKKVVKKTLELSSSNSSKMVSNYSNGKTSNGSSSTNGSAAHHKEHHNSGGSDNNDTISGGSTASKLSKIGRRLRDSCRNFRGKTSNGCNVVSHNPEDYTSLQAPNDSTRSRNFAPMDFSGQSGRIIDHKDMDNSLASSERPANKDGCAYFRRKIDTSKVDHLLTNSQATIHRSQPWFHKSVSRQLAQKILSSHNFDGLFLVRDSSVAGGFVISYFFSGRTYHTQVLPIVTPEERVTYSLDNGRTRFFDLLQMVEYYQLNRGTLNHRLTHYVVSKSICDSTTTSNRPESPAARSDSSSCRGTSDGSLDSQTSSHDVCADDDSTTSLLPTSTSLATTKIDSNHNSSVGSFNQDLVSETSTMSDGENSVATAVAGRIDEDYVSDANDDDDVVDDDRLHHHKD